MGCISAIVFACFGAAYGTAMAGIIGIYGLVVSILVANDIKQSGLIYRLDPLRVFPSGLLV
jgi:V-type H+-transporting ATPase proteolipid subunit